MPKPRKQLQEPPTATPLPAPNIRRFRGPAEGKQITVRPAELFSYSYAAFISVLVGSPVYSARGTGNGRVWRPGGERPYRGSRTSRLARDATRLWESSCTVTRTGGVKVSGSSERKENVFSKGFLCSSKALLQVGGVVAGGVVQLMATTRGRNSRFVCYIPTAHC